MRALAARPRVVSVDDPTTYNPFATFSCGGSSPHEQEVDEIVGMLHRGEYPAEIVRAAEHADTRIGHEASVSSPRGDPLLVVDSADDAQERLEHLAQIGLLATARR